MRYAPRLWQWWLILAPVAIAGYFLLPIDDLPKNMYYNGISMASAAMIAIGARRHRPPRAVLWYLFSAGQALWAIGDVAYGINTHILHLDRFPSIADLPYLCGYPVLAAGLFVLIRGRTSGRDRAGLLDAAIISTGLVLPTWTFVMRPMLGYGLEPLALIVSLAYPAGDVLLIAMAARLFVTPGARTTSYRMLTTALLLLLGGDIVYAWLTTWAAYEGGAVDAAWLLSYMIWAAAALHPSMRSLSETAPDRAVRVTGRRLALLTATSLLAPTVLIMQGIGIGVNAHDIDWLGISVSAITLFLLVLARMSGLVNQVQDQAAQLDALAHNDALTGVPNRRAWDLELARRLANSRRTGEQVVVALLDLDHFKRFNDQYGHQAGDRLLKEASAAWRSQLRNDDLLARYGGEEFGICVTGLSTTAVAGLLDRLQAVTPLGQSFSGGLARWTGDEAPERLVGRADQALYRAKEEGRRRVTIHDSDAVSAVDVVDLPAVTA
jgi:diguanylate cyclase (GGDEF)-like protein